MIHLDKLGSMIKIRRSVGTQQRRSSCDVVWVGVEWIRLNRDVVFMPAEAEGLSFAELEAGVDGRAEVGVGGEGGEEPEKTFFDSVALSDNLLSTCTHTSTRSGTVT